MIDNSMQNEFYIVKCREDWWQLRLTFNKECISTSKSLDKLLISLEGILKRYSTPEELHYAWRKTDFRKMSEQEKERNVKLYKEKGQEYNEYIVNTIEKLNNAIINTKLNVKRKKLSPNKTLNVNTVIDVVNEAPQNLVIKKRKRLIKR